MTVDMNMKFNVCISGCLEIIQLLLARPEVEGNLQDNDGNSALLHACKRGDHKIVEAMLHSGQCDKNVQNKFGQTPLHEAAKSGNIGIVAALLFQGVDPNVQVTSTWTSDSINIFLIIPICQTINTSCILYPENSSIIIIRTFYPFYRSVKKLLYL
jgi:ankyrin repeat protein